MALEQLGAEITVRFVGEEQFRRYTAGLAAAAGATEAAVSRMNAAWDQSARGMLSAAAAQATIMRELGLGASQMRAMQESYNAFSRGLTPPQGLRETRALVQGLERDMRKLTSGSGLGGDFTSGLRSQVAALVTQQLGQRSASALPPPSRIDNSQARVNARLERFLAQAEGRRGGGPAPTAALPSAPVRPPLPPGGGQYLGTPAQQNINSRLERLVQQQIDGQRLARPQVASPSAQSRTIGPAAGPEWTTLRQGSWLTRELPPPRPRPTYYQGGEQPTPYRARLEADGYGSMSFRALDQRRAELERARRERESAREFGSRQVGPLYGRGKIGAYAAPNEEMYQYSSAPSQPSPLRNVRFADSLSRAQREQVMREVPEGSRRPVVVHGADAAALAERPGAAGFAYGPFGLQRAGHVVMGPELVRGLVAHEFAHADRRGPGRLGLIAGDHDPTRLGREEARADVNAIERVSRPARSDYESLAMGLGGSPSRFNDPRFIQGYRDVREKLGHPVSGDYLPGGKYAASGSLAAQSLGSRAGQGNPFSDTDWWKRETGPKVDLTRPPRLPRQPNYVRDEHGIPVRVYHGTTAAFKDFDDARVGSKIDNGWYGRGHYFTEKSGLGFAGTYATGGSGGSSHTGPGGKLEDYAPNIRMARLSGKVIDWFKDKIPLLDAAGIAQKMGIPPEAFIRVMDHGAGDYTRPDNFKSGVRTEGLTLQEMRQSLKLRNDLDPPEVRGHFATASFKDYNDALVPYLQGRGYSGIRHTNSDNAAGPPMYTMFSAKNIHSPYDATPQAVAAARSELGAWSLAQGPSSRPVPPVSFSDRSQKPAPAGPVPPGTIIGSSREGIGRIQARAKEAAYQEDFAARSRVATAQGLLSEADALAAALRRVSAEMAHLKAATENMGRSGRTVAGQLTLPRGSATPLTPLAGYFGRPATPPDPFKLTTGAYSQIGPPVQQGYRGFTPRPPSAPGPENAVQAVANAQKWASFYQNLGPPPKGVYGVTGLGTPFAGQRGTFNFGGSTYGPGAGIPGYGQGSQSGAGGNVPPPRVVPGNVVPPPPPPPPPVPPPPPPPPYAGPPRGQGGPGFSDQFGQGFRGRGDRPYAEQLGQVAKFAVFYGGAYRILGLITGTFTQSLQEAIKFQQSMAELNIITGRTSKANKDLAQHLGDTAAAVGLSPSAGLEIGARAIGLNNLQDAPQVVQEAAARRATTTVSHLSITTGRTGEQLQGDVGAITQAFGYGYASTNQIADLDAYFTKRFGIGTGKTLETVAQSGSLGVQAGFSPEEIFAISGKLQSRTGQTPAAVAGLLSQIFSRSGEGALQGQFQALGVDVTASFREQLEELSKLYPTLSSGQQQTLTASFGRGRSQGAAAILLEDFGQITGAARSAQTEAGGSAENQFNARMNNVGGQLAQLGGAFKSFGVEFGNSGLLDAVGAAAIALREFLKTMTGVLRLWNDLPRVMKDAILAVGAFALASKLGAGGAVAARIIGQAGLVSTATRTGAPLLIGSSGRVVTGAAAAGATTIRGATAIAAGGAVATAGVAGRAAAGGGALVRGLGVNPYVAGALATLAVIGIGRNTYEKLQAASQQATDTLIAIGSIDASDPQALGSAAQQLDDSAKKRRDLPFVADVISAFGGGSQRQANKEADALTADAKFARALQNVREHAVAADAVQVRRDTSDFGDVTATAVTTGFGKLTSAGRSAAEQLELYSAAIDGTADSAARAARAAFDLSDFTGQIAVTAKGQLLANIPDQILAGTRTVTTGDLIGAGSLPTTPGQFGPNDGLGLSSKVSAVVPNYIDGKLLSKDLARIAPTDQEIQNRLTTVARNAGVTSGALSDTQARLIAQAQVDLQIPAELKGHTPAVLDAIRKRAFSFALAKLKDSAAKEKANQDPNRAFTPDQAVQQLAALQPTLDANLAQVGAGDLQGKARAALANVTSVRQLQGRTSGSVPALIAAVRTAEAAFAEAKVDELKALQAQAVRGEPNLAGAVSQGRGYLQRMIAVAARNGNSELLASLISGAGKASIAFARGVIAQTRSAEIAAVKTSSEIRSIEADYHKRAAAFFQNLPSINDPAAQDSDYQGKTAEEKAAYDKAIAGSEYSLGREHTAQTSNSLRETYEKDRKAAIKSETQAAKDKAAESLRALKIGESRGPSDAALAAAREAAGLRPGDTPGAARAALHQAQSDLQDLAVRPDSLEYIKALKVVQDLKVDLANAERDNANIVANNQAARVGGSLAQARASLATATIDLGKFAVGTQEYNRSLAAYFAAQNGFADAVREAQLNAALLKTDLTDPVAEAHANTNSLKAKLTADQNRFASGGIDADERAVLDTDKLDVRRSQNTEEAAKFQQRFTDAQTAESLGRISHAAYIRYLQNEHNRLAAIHHKTRQQRDQLDQIDGALKAARDAMSGQFNLGDIKLPTPYEVRRYIKAATDAQLVGAGVSGSVRAQNLGQLSTGVPSGSTTQIYINGADIGLVNAHLDKAVAGGVHTNSTAAKKA